MAIDSMCSLPAALCKPLLTTRSLSVALHAGQLASVMVVELVVICSSSNQ